MPNKIQLINEIFGGLKEEALEQLPEFHRASYAIDKIAKIFNDRKTKISQKYERMEDEKDGLDDGLNDRG